VGGDRVSLDIELQPQAQALITTATAGKIYRFGRTAKGEKVFAVKWRSRTEIGRGRTYLGSKDNCHAFFDQKP
jgi:urease accessory protein UreH